MQTLLFVVGGVFVVWWIARSLGQGANTWAAKEMGFALGALTKSLHKSGGVA